MSKRIVVTGAAGNLGKVALQKLSRRGLSVTGIDLSATGPDGSEFIGGVDLTSGEQVAEAMKKAAGEGEIDGLVNIAGGFCWERIADGSAESWERMFMMNTMTALNACRAILPFLSPGGSIVNVGAAATAKASVGMGAYTASKSGVARLTEALAEELKEKRIRVNAVLPSIIDTPANRRDMGEADADKWVKPSELAEVIAFLVSDAASAITGASIPVLGRV